MAAEGEVADWISKYIAGGGDAPTKQPAGDEPVKSGKPAEVFLKYPEPTEQRGAAIHEGLMKGPLRLTKGNKPVPQEWPVLDQTPEVKPAAVPDIPGSTNPRIESWMNNDPMTWYPKESGEWTRWRKTLPNKDLVEWDSKIRPLTAKYHLMTRTYGNQVTQTPEYRAYRQMYDDFMKRTVRRWREHEKVNPPRRYRPRISAIQALDGIEVG